MSANCSVICCWTWSNISSIASIYSYNFKSLSQFFIDFKLLYHGCWYLLKLFPVTVCINSLCIHIQYGKDYDLEAPVKLLDKLLYEMPQSPDEQIVVVSQVLFFPSHFYLFIYAIVGSCCMEIVSWSYTHVFSTLSNCFKGTSGWYQYRIRGHCQHPG